MPNSVFITGVKTGVGLEFVRQFATCEHPPKYIFASARNPKSAKALCALADKYKNVHLVDLDVSNDQQIDAAAKLVASLVGDDGLNLLINNAAVLLTEGTALPHLKREAINRHFDVNATSPLLLIQAFLPLIKNAAEKRPTAEMSISKAAIINITSETGSFHNKLLDDSDNSLGQYFGFGYRPSKAALNLITKHLSFDLKNDGILIVAICPGYVDTNMAAQLDKFLQGRAIPQVVLTAKKETPEESVTSIMGTMQRLTDKHNGGYFRRNGEKIEDFDFAPATE